MTFRSRSDQILLFSCIRQINVVDVRKGAKPCKDICEFLFEVFSISRILRHIAVFGVNGLQRCGQFANFLDEPHVRCGCAAGTITFIVSIVDVFLEGGDCERCFVQNRILLGSCLWFRDNGDILG